MNVKNRNWYPPSDWVEAPLNMNLEPMLEAEDDPGDYRRTVIGIYLNDGEAGQSFIEIITGDGRESDRALANFIIDSCRRAMRPDAPQPAPTEQP
jgi:hypothetical protein